MPNEGDTPKDLKLHNHSVTELYVQLQICKEFGGIDPLKFFFGSDAKWEDYPYFKKVLFVFRLLNAEEEKRQLDEAKKINKNNNVNNPPRRRKTRSI